MRTVAPAFQNFIKYEGTLVEAVTSTVVNSVVASCAMVTVGGLLVLYVPMKLPLKFELNQLFATAVTAVVWELMVWPRGDDYRVIVMPPSPTAGSHESLPL